MPSPPDAIAILSSYLRGQPQLLQDQFCIEIVASPTAAKRTSPDPIGLDTWTRHQQMAWHAVQARACAAAKHHAAIGQAWGQPGFGVGVKANEKGRLHIAASWAGAGTYKSINWPTTGSDTLPNWQPRYYDHAFHQNFHDRLDALTPGPQGPHVWMTSGPTWKNAPLLAGTAKEATTAACALWHAAPTTVSQMAMHTAIHTHRVYSHGHVTATPCPTTLDQIDTPLIGSARCAARAAAHAVRRWDFDDEADFTTGVLNVRTLFQERTGVSRYLTNQPHALEASWADVSPGTGFDEGFAQEARAELLAFGSDLMQLPGLARAPIALDLYINAIPGGEVLMGMSIANAPKYHAHKAVHTHHNETSPAAFLRDWEWRLAGLRSLAAPTSLWCVSLGRWFDNTHVVSAACAQDAVAAVAFIWGEPGQPVKPYYVTKLTSLAELGITHDDINAFEKAHPAPAHAA